MDQTTVVAFDEPGIPDGESGGQTSSSRRAKQLTWLTRIGSAIAVVLIAILGVFMVAGIAHADEDEDRLDMYGNSSNLTTFFSNAARPGETLDGNKWDLPARTPAEGGIYLGYGDNDVSGLGSWLISKVTGSTNTIGYDALKANEEGEAIKDGKYFGILSYAQYGSLLADLGLDSTTSGFGTTAMSLLGGAVLYILFLLTSLVDAVFYIVLSLLDMFNPFRLFYGGVKESQSATFADGMVQGDNGTGWGWIKSLQTWVGGWYTVLVNISWTVIMPVFLAVFIMSALLWRRSSAMSGFKKLAIRFVFLGLGVPLLGSMYTATLSSMKASSGGASAGSTRVIISTLVDFESWAKNSRLAVPDGHKMVWDDKRMGATGQTRNKVRELSAAINRTSNDGFEGVSEFGTEGLKDISAGNKTEGGNYGAIFGSTHNIILRFMLGNKYTASDFETGVKGWITEEARRVEKTSGEGLEKGFYDAHACGTTWFSVDKNGDHKEKADDKVTGGKCKSLGVDDNPTLRVKEGSGLQATWDKSNRYVTFKTKGDKKPGYAVLDKKRYGRAEANLSPLAMFNFLNSKFESNSVTTYSSANAASAASREVHRSVNLVGSGGTGFLYWVNASVMLISFIVIGFSYAMGMMIGAVRNMLRLLTAVPFATLGAIPAISKVIIYTIAMILQIMGTLFIYRVVQEIILSVPSIFESAADKLITESRGGKNQIDKLTQVDTNFTQFMAEEGLISAFTAALSTIAIILLTMVLVRFRGKFVKAIEDAAAKFIDRFMDTNTGSPSTGGMAALGGAAGAGVGMMAANKMMGGNAGDSNTDANSTGTTVSSGVTTETNTSGSGGIDGGSDGDGVPSINGTDGDDPSGGGALTGSQPKALEGSSSSGGTDGPDGPDGSSDSGGSGASDSGSSIDVNQDNSSSDNVDVNDSTNNLDNSSSTSESDRDIANRVLEQGGLSNPSTSDTGISGATPTQHNGTDQDSADQRSGTEQDSPDTSGPREAVSAGAAGPEGASRGGVVTPESKDSSDKKDSGDKDSSDGKAPRGGIGQTAGMSAAVAAGAAAGVAAGMSRGSGNSDGSGKSPSGFVSSAIQSVGATVNQKKQQAQNDTIPTAQPAAKGGTAPSAQPVQPVQPKSRTAGMMNAAAASGALPPTLKGAAQLGAVAAERRREKKGPRETKE